MNKFNNCALIYNKFFLDKYTLKLNRIYFTHVTVVRSGQSVTLDNWMRDGMFDNFFMKKRMATNE
jgi:hypothetical protein